MLRFIKLRNNANPRGRNVINSKPLLRFVPILIIKPPCGFNNGVSNEIRKNHSCISIKKVVKIFHLNKSFEEDIEDNNEMPRIHIGYRVQKINISEKR